MTPPPELTKEQRAEEWRSVIECPSYQVSNLGRVRRTSGRLLNPFPSSKGYLRIALRKIGEKTIYRKVAVLALTAFIGPRPPGYQAAHLNGIKTDDRLENLQWVTPKENEAHKFIHGTALLGEKQVHAKLNPEKVREIRALYAQGISAPRIAAQYGLDPSMVLYIKDRKYWKHVA